MTTRVTTGSETASDLIDARIQAHDDWRGETLAGLRALIKDAVPSVVEEWKWDGPVWASDGIICTGEIYKDKVKITFMNGASLDDPHRLFNASLDAGTRRAIDIVEGVELEAEAFQALVREAVAFNIERAPAKRRT